MSAPSGSLVGVDPPASPTPAAPLTAYVGTYGNDYVGPATISQNDGELTLSLGPKTMTFPLTHWDGDTFIYVPTGESANFGSLSKLAFTRATNGTATSMDVEYYERDGQNIFTR